MKVFLQLVFILTLTSCTQVDESSNQFLNKITDAFSDGRSEISLTDVTDFEWNEACFFQYDDSPKYLTYDQYAAFLSDKFGTNAKPMPRHSYTNIVVLLNEGVPVKTYGFTSDHIEISDQKYILSLGSPYKDGGSQCHPSSDLIIQLIPASKGRTSGFYIASRRDLDNANNHSD